MPQFFLYTLSERRRASYVFGPGKYNIILTLRAESSIIQLILDIHVTCILRGVGRYTNSLGNLSIHVEVQLILNISICIVREV